MGKALPACWAAWCNPASLGGHTSAQLILLVGMADTKLLGSASIFLCLLCKIQLGRKPWLMWQLQMQAGEACAWVPPPWAGDAVAPCDTALQAPRGTPPPQLPCLLAPAIPGYFLKYGPHFLFLHLLQMQITDESINYTNHYSEEHLSNCWTWTEQLVVNLLYNHCLQQESKCFNCANIMKGEVNHRDKF